MNLILQWQKTKEGESNGRFLFKHSLVNLSLYFLLVMESDTKRRIRKVNENNNWDTIFIRYRLTEIQLDFSVTLSTENFLIFYFVSMYLMTLHLNVWYYYNTFMFYCELVRALFCQWPLLMTQVLLPQTVPIHPIPWQHRCIKFPMSNLSQNSSESFTALGDLPIPNPCKTQVIDIL